MGSRRAASQPKIIKLQAVPKEYMKLSAKAQQSLEKVVQKFKTGDISAISKVARIRLDPQAPALHWSLSNKVLSIMQSGELDCRGFRQWEKAGRRIKKGSKAVYILRPTVVGPKKKGGEQDEDEQMCIGFSAVPVFPVSATEGESSAVGYEPKELPELVSVAKKFGISVEYVPTLPDRLGDCTSDGKSIRVGSHNPAVFFHELAHAIHAQISGKLEGKQTEVQETIAEFTATVLMDIYGYTDHTGNAWNYISKYAKDPIIAISKALSMVEKVVSVLLDEESIINS